MAVTLPCRPVVPESSEQVLFHGHPSWRSMLEFQLKGLLVMVVAGVIAGLATAAAAGHVQVGWVIVAVVAVFLVAAALGWLRRRSTTYTITTQRLSIQLGLFSRELHETQLERVQNVGSRQSLLERLLGIGTVDFDTAGGAGFDFAFRGVADPHGIVRTVHLALRAALPPAAPGASEPV
jgi:uncharacterized membrane protein YdbT with pleckstrin-like domain